MLIMATLTHVSVPPVVRAGLGVTVIKLSLITGGKVETFLIVRIAPDTRVNRAETVTVNGFSIKPFKLAIFYVTTDFISLF